MSTRTCSRCGATCEGCDDSSHEGHLCPSCQAFAARGWPTILELAPLKVLDMAEHLRLEDEDGAICDLTDHEVEKLRDTFDAWLRKRSERAPWELVKLGGVMDIERHKTLKCSSCGKGFMRPPITAHGEMTTIWLDANGNLLCSNTCTRILRTVALAKASLLPNGPPRPPCICGGVTGGRLIRIDSTATGLPVRFECSDESCGFKVELE